MSIPTLLLRQLYTYGSLANTADGVRLVLQNRLMDATLTGLRAMRLDGEAVDLERVRLRFPDGASLAATEISDASPLRFPLRGRVEVQAERSALDPGMHRIDFSLDTLPFGRVELGVRDSLAAPGPEEPHVPRDEADDLAEPAIQRRQAFVEEYSGRALEHVPRYSFDPRLVEGNCENFTGVAQVPLGFAGPLHVRGEAAQGRFLVPLATSEGTLVASYNRGIQLLNRSGGVKCTVVGDAMQRAPVFGFEDARRGVEFVRWVEASEEQIRAQAEATSRTARLEHIEPYVVSRFVYLRFNFSTGDAAGQNMVSKATHAACGWILDHFPGVLSFCLDSNLSSDKKFSHVNTLRGRGKRVTAEAVIPRDLLIERLRAEPEAMVRHYQVSNLSSVLAGANNNGLHAANAVTAMFIATGQDVANVAESSAALFYAELTPARDLYVSITLPSLIVATYGGGTGLATQRECLEVMGCYGAGKVRKLAEIVAGVVLAGELSLGGAITADEWVASHERLGRNR